MVFKFLKIEKRKRNENSVLQTEREKDESFLETLLSRSRLLSKTDLGPIKMDVSEAKTQSQKYCLVIGD